MKELYLSLLFLFFPLSLVCSADISFSGGTTQMHMQQGMQAISLSDGATITSGSLKLQAQTIEMEGKDFRYVTCSGNVSLTDDERGVSLKAQNLYYDRQSELILIDGYLQLDDQTNEVLASAFHLEYSIQEGMILLQAQVRLYKHTDSGAMACKSDSLRFDREAQKLVLEGNAFIDWDSDTYEAQRITVDLTTEAITMEGSIKGVVNG